MRLSLRSLDSAARRISVSIVDVSILCPQFQQFMSRIAGLKASFVKKMDNRVFSLVDTPLSAQEKSLGK